MKEKQNRDKLLIIALLVIIILLLVMILILFLKDDKISFRNQNLNQNSDVYENENSTNTNPTNSISKEKALEIVLEDVKLNQKDIYDLSIELDYKYNQMVYENYEYEYYVNCETGKIIHSFKERD